METTKVLLKPLNGSNYATWKVQCKMALIKEGLWNIVNRTELISNDATREQKEKFSLRRDKALAMIVLSVEPKWLYILGSDPTDPTEVWHKLADQFQRKSWANKLSLRRKLYSLKLNEGQSVQSHIKAITEIFDELSIIGDPLDDEKKGGERSTELLGKVHSDVCGKIEVKSLSGAEYFVTFIDDKSRYVWTYVLKNKSDVFKKFHEWKAMVEKSSGMKLKTFRTDNGGEYTSNEFEEYLRQDGTQHETTVPKTPQQNGVAERMNRTLIDSVRAMLSDSKLPKRFWAEALSTATYLHNRSPTNAVKGMTPYEAWTGVKPNVSHLRVFGCDAYPHIPKDERSKMDPKAKKSIFLGYGDGVKGYRLYNKEQQRIFYSRDVVFNETKATQANNPAEGNEVLEQPLIEIETTENDATVEAEAEDVNQQRPQRERRAPDRLGDWVYVAKDLHDPMTVEEALSRKNKDDWRLAMEDEVNSMFNNDVWDLVELPKGRKAVGSKWVFKTKHDADGNLQRYKARLVAQGYNQKQGIDYDETFSPVVRFESIRTIISLAAQHNLHLHQIDGWLKEDIYMKQPQEFEVKGKEHLVCKLKRSIYGLKQSPRCWNDELDTFMKELGLKQSNNDPCIYILESKNVFLVVGVFVDDLVIAGSLTESIKDFIEKLSRKFKVKDMGKLHYFLGVQVNQKPGKIWIGQPTYTKEILEKFNMENSKPVSTPVEQGTKLTNATEEEERIDTELYQSAIGSLLYLSSKTRPDIAFAVGSVARFCQQPSMQHWKAVKCIFRYLRGTAKLGLLYENNSNNKSIVGYSDADWAGDIGDRKSTSGYVFTLNGAAVSWKSKKQACVALSTAEAEYMALSSAAQEAVWIQRFLEEVDGKTNKPMTIYEDHQSTICMSQNPRFHGRAKHIDIKYHFIREQISTNAIELKYCKSEEMIADILTKGLGRIQFEKLRKLIGMKPLSDIE